MVAEGGEYPLLFGPESYNAVYQLILIFFFQKWSNTTTRLFSYLLIMRHYCFGNIRINPSQMTCVNRNKICRGLYGTSFTTTVANVNEPKD